MHIEENLFSGGTNFLQVVPSDSVYAFGPPSVLVYSKAGKTSLFLQFGPSLTTFVAALGFDMRLSYKLLMPAMGVYCIVLHVVLYTILRIKKKNASLAFLIKEKNTVGKSTRKQPYYVIISVTCLAHHVSHKSDETMVTVPFSINSSLP